jgi:hypothetical protein
MNKKHNDIDKIIASASATLAVEGLKPSKSGAAITRQYLEGNITSEQAIEKIKKIHLNTLVR